MRELNTSFASIRKFKHTKNVLLNSIISYKLVINFRRFPQYARIFDNDTYTHTKKKSVIFFMNLISNLLF